MPIVYKSGNPLDEIVEVYVIPVSADGLLTSGLPAAAKAKFPSGAAVFQGTCAKNELKVGDLGYSAKQGEHGRTWVVWLVVKEKAADTAGLADIERAVKTLEKYLNKYSFDSICLPPLPGDKAAIRQIYGAFEREVKDLGIDKMVAYEGA